MTIEPVPAWVQGVWRRKSPRVESGLIDDTTRVYWIQTPTLFADIRVPAECPDGAGKTSLADYGDDALPRLADQAGFAGSLSVDGRIRRWRRPIDYQPPRPSPDEGAMFREGDRLTETGLHANNFEDYTLLDDGGGRFLALDCPQDSRLLVIAGNRFLFARGRAVALPEGAALGDLVAEADPARINDILDYSKLESGKLELEDTDFDIVQVIDGVRSLIGHRVKPGVKFHTAIDPALPQWLRADHGRLRQILFNLVGNAMKFTDKGRVTISASHRVVDGDELELRVEVSDTGIGLSDDAQARLFSRFVQADSSTTRRFGGTGLGLAICKQLVELMGGGIGVMSKPDVGSTFWFTIRCRVGEAPALCAPDTASPDLSWAQPLRILVAEDNHINQMLVTEFINKAGHRCDVVGNGLEAVEAVSRTPYDLVLMDIQMPEMDGPTATREIRRLPGTAADIPIIAVTANAMEGHREEYFAAGMNDYVSKPIDPTLLMEAIARVCPPDVDNAEAATLLAEDLTEANDDHTADVTPLFDEAGLGELRDAIGEAKIQEILADLSSESNKLPREIQDALAAGDLDTARKAAHGLTGMAGNFCAVRVAAIAKEIETEATTIEAAERESENLKLAIEQTQQWLEKSS